MDLLDRMVGPYTAEGKPRVREGDDLREEQGLKSSLSPFPFSWGLWAQGWDSHSSWLSYLFASLLCPVEGDHSRCPINACE